MKSLFLHLFLLAIALTMILPFAYMVSTSLLIRYSESSIGFEWQELTFENYRLILRSYNFLRYFGNSSVVVTVTCILNALVSSMAGYGFAKKSFPLRNVIFFILLITLMIPSQVIMVPLYLMMSRARLLNTYFALVMPLITPFGTFLMRQFIQELPDELIQAAVIDGARESAIFARIVLPMSRSALVALTIFTFITAWNSFLWPLIATTSDSMRTIILGLSVLKGNYSTNYGLVMAGAALTFLPPFIVYLLLQKRFVEGVTLSGIKG
ncbi:MAG: carbohydrate ABC transporter permease [Spirochaetales bacterium]|nr:carbohydrate ABC transporter permease [Spirochaetales bacterium]